MGMAIVPGTSLELERWGNGSCFRALGRQPWSLLLDPATASRVRMQQSHQDADWSLKMLRCCPVLSVARMLPSPQSSRLLVLPPEWVSCLPSPWQCATQHITACTEFIDVTWEMEGNYTPGPQTLQFYSTVLVPRDLLSTFLCGECLIHLLKPRRGLYFHHRLR